MVKKPYIPKGCDYQGRYPESAERYDHPGRYPEAAESATEVGADNPPLHDLMRVVLGDLAIAAALVAAVAVVVLVAVGRVG